MKTGFDYVISEIERYSAGVHELKDGIDENIVQLFENQYNITIPLVYRQWLKI